MSLFFLPQSSHFTRMTHLFSASEDLIHFFIYFTVHDSDLAPLSNEVSCCACSPCQVQTKAPQTLIDIGMNFGVRVAFDYGNCTGPDCKFDWEPLGLEMQHGTTHSLSLSRYILYPHVYIYIYIFYTQPHVYIYIWSLFACVLQYLDLTKGKQSTFMIK